MKLSQRRKMSNTKNWKFSANSWKFKGVCLNHNIRKITLFLTWKREDWEKTHSKLALVGIIPDAISSFIADKERSDSWIRWKKKKKRNVRVIGRPRFESRRGCSVFFSFLFFFHLNQLSVLPSLSPWRWKNERLCHALAWERWGGGGGGGLAIKMLVSSLVYQSLSIAKSELTLERKSSSQTQFKHGLLKDPRLSFSTKKIGKAKNRHTRENNAFRTGIVFCAVNWLAYTIWCVG